MNKYIMQGLMRKIRCFLEHYSTNYIKHAFNQCFECKNRHVLIELLLTVSTWLAEFWFFHKYSICSRHKQQFNIVWLS